VTISGVRIEQLCILLQVFCRVTGFTSDFLSSIVVEHIRFFHRALQFSWLWRQRADERLGDPPPKVDPGAFSGQRGMENPQEDPLEVHCLCVCSGSALLGDLRGVSTSMERDLLSVLLIYPRIFWRVFLSYRLLVGFLFVWLYSAICSCVLVVLVKLSVLAKLLAIEIPLWWHLHKVRRLSPQSPGGRVCLCVFFFCLIC